MLVSDGGVDEKGKRNNERNVPRILVLDWRDASMRAMLRSPDGDC